MKTERLDRLLAGSGCLTRAEARDAVRAGLVCVNGAVERDPGAKTARSSVVTLRGEPIDTAEYVYYMLHKPAGFVSGAAPEGGLPPVTELLPAQLRRRGLSCAGRLDADVTGLLLLTDDGALAHRIMSPRSALPKTYRVRTDGPLTEEDAVRLAAGVTLRDGTAYRPARLAVDPGDSASALVTVTEGKYHEVKNLMAVCGRRVLSLSRISVGGLSLDPALAPGEGRRLTPEEVKGIFISYC